MKQIVVLVGPKGAGKSTIGRLLADELGINFIRVEPLFLEVRSRLGANHPDFERQGFERVLDTVRHALRNHDEICFESTGASPHVAWLLSELARSARVLPIRILVESNQCLERIHRRDASVHIPVSDNDVERINALASKVVLPWAADIDNRGDFDPERILSTIRRVLEPPEA